MWTNTDFVRQAICQSRKAPGRSAWFAVTLLLFQALIASQAVAQQEREVIAPPAIRQDGSVLVDPQYLDFLSGPMAYPRSQELVTGSRPAVPPAQRQSVHYVTAEKPGTIIIETGERALYLVRPHDRAIRYAVGIGREGYGWTGNETISQKRIWPDWRPPQDMRARRPDLPVHMKGGPDNPLGARALYLGNTLYRIHGSNEPDTVGQPASSGCFRMTNADVVHLYERVELGSSVIVR